MKDLKYILKRILIGVGIALTLMFIKSNVFAATYNITPSSCGWSTSSSYTNGTVSGNTTATNLSSPFYYCSGSTGNFWSQRYNIVTPSNISSSSGTLSFNIYGPTISNVIIRTGGYDYSCVLNTGLEIDTSNNKVYSVTCGNVPNSSSRTWTIYTYKANSGTTNIFISSNFVYIPNENISSVINNQTQQQHQDSQDTQQAISDVNDSITSNTTPSGSDTSSAYSNFDNATAQNGVITQLITLPITLFTNINNNINTTCTRFDMGTLLGTHIYFNCINPANYIGSSLWNILDILCCGFFVWFIGKKLIKVFENLSSMKEGDPVGD